MRFRNKKGLKVKLLKKVRKRFEITRYNEHVSNADEIQRDFKTHYGTPIYWLVDKNETDVFAWGIFKKYDQAVDSILKKVLKEYGKKFRHKPSKKEKVWWVNKK